MLRFLCVFFFFFFFLGGGDTETKSRVKAHFSWPKKKKKMYNRVIVLMWTAWCTRLKYSQNVEITEETTDFENCTRGQAETRNASFLDVEYKTIPHRASSVHFGTGHFYPFRKLPVWVQTFETWITRYPWEKKNPENVSKLTNLWFKRTRNFRCNQIRNEIHRVDQTFVS